MKKHNKQKSRKEKKDYGFTLIEILVVIVIIAIIFSVLFVTIDTARKRTRDAIIISSLEQIQAIGKTVYNPIDDYKELYNMRKSAYVPEDHPRIKEIREKIEGVGSSFNFNFLKDISATATQPKGEYSEFCVWAPLFMDTGKKFCVDHRGKSIITKEEINCEHIGIDSAGIKTPRNCDYR